MIYPNKYLPGGAIGAGLFVGSGAALQSGGPASLVICYLIIGIMLLFTCQALAELAVLYPVNGAFFTYIVRFIDPSWGFAMGWDYAISWLTILPFELVAASITIQYWRDDLNMGEFLEMLPNSAGIAQLLSFIFRYLGGCLPRRTRCHSVLRCPRLR